MEDIEGIRVVDETKTDMDSFAMHLADCVVLTHDNKLLLQYRPPSWRKTPYSMNIFGGHVEKGEGPMQGVVRELNEELGAKIDPRDLVHLGSVTEDFTQHTECVNIFFWHDKNNTITGCYEAESRSFDNPQDVLSNPEVMDYTRWAIKQALDRGLLDVMNTPSKTSKPPAPNKPASSP